MSNGQIIAITLCLVMAAVVIRYLLNEQDRTSGKRRIMKEDLASRDDELVTVATFDLAFDAERANSILQAADLTSFVMDGNVIGLNQALTWAAGGVRLQVPLRQASRAQEVLQESGFRSLTDLRAYHHCPQCNSTDIVCHGLSRLQMIAAVMFFGALLLFLKRDYSCNSCSHQWSS